MVILAFKVRIKKQENNQNQNKTFQGKKFAISHQKTVTAEIFENQNQDPNREKNLNYFRILPTGFERFDLG